MYSTLVKTIKTKKGRKIMRHKIYYGMNPNIRNYRPQDFSERKYDCHYLFQTGRGMPVAVSKHKEKDFWKVQFGFSTVVFRTEAEALAYCKGRFRDADGQAV